MAWRKGDQLTARDLNGMKASIPGTIRGIGGVLVNNYGDAGTTVSAQKGHGGATFRIKTVADDTAALASTNPDRTFLATLDHDKLWWRCEGVTICLTHLE